MLILGQKIMRFYLWNNLKVVFTSVLFDFYFTLCIMFVRFCNDMIIASARLKNCSPTFKLDPAGAVLVWVRDLCMISMKEKC